MLVKLLETHKNKNMIIINIEPADNGVIKFIIDDNINGAGEEHIARKVYDFESTNQRSTQIKFLNDLILDLGIDTGTDLDSNKLKIEAGWGNQYEPSQPELKIRIKLLQAELKKLNGLISE